jgi:RNA polymerase sigma-70 factor (ECF subfamily)
MLDTSSSLLERLRRPSDGVAWQRLLDLYTPLIRHWLSRHYLQPCDVEDVTQEVLAVVVRKLPDFRHDGQLGAFRSWLRAITANCLRSYWRSGRNRPRATGDSDFLHSLEALEDPDSPLSRLWNQEYERHVLRRLVELVEPEVKPTTWRAFWGQVMEGKPADAVAAELGRSVNAVLIAKSRVLQRLRQELRGLLDEVPERL